MEDVKYSVTGYSEGDNSIGSSFKGIVRETLVIQAHISGLFTASQFIMQNRNNFLD